MWIHPPPMGHMFRPAVSTSIGRWRTHKCWCPEHSRPRTPNSLGGVKKSENISSPSCINTIKPMVSHWSLGDLPLNWYRRFCRVDSNQLSFRLTGPMCLSITLRLTPIELHAYEQRYLLSFLQNIHNDCFWINVMFLLFLSSFMVF